MVLCPVDWFALCQGEKRDTKRPTSKDQVSRAEKLEDLSKMLAIQPRFLRDRKKGRWHSLKLATRSKENRGEVNFLGRFYPLL